MSNKIYMLRKTPSPLLVLAAGFVMASSKSLKAALGMGMIIGNHGLISFLLCYHTA